MPLRPFSDEESSTSFSRYGTVSEKYLVNPLAKLPLK